MIKTELVGFLEAVLILNQDRETIARMADVGRLTNKGVVILQEA